MSKLYGRMEVDEKGMHAVYADMNDQMKEHYATNRGKSQELLMPFTVDIRRSIAIYEQNRNKESEIKD